MKKIVALLLTAMMLLSLTACGGGDKPSNSGTSTSAPTPSTTGTGVKEDEGGDSIVLWYGSNHYGGYEATFYCPEGAYIDEDDLAEYKEDGSVMSFTVYDDVREYQAYAENHWSRDIYTSDPEVYEVTPQLYFYGELDDYNAAEYENCSQTVTDLGFQWEGKDVMLLETRYTMPGYSEQVELFVCVEFENEYWRVKDGGQGGTEEHLFAPALVGFELSSWNELTVDQCAWIAGELFGVDSGRTWPLEGEGEEPEPAVVNVDAEELIGTWLERDSDWDNTLIFNADGTGMLISGPEYPFTYAVSGDILAITYDDGDEEEFTVTSVTSELLTMVDNFGNELLLDKKEEVVETGEAADVPAELIGTWTDEAGTETYAFNADGSGYQIYEDIEYSYTYKVSDDRLWISYDNGSEDDFSFYVDDDKLVIMNSWIYIRQ